MVVGQSVKHPEEYKLRAKQYKAKFVDKLSARKLFHAAAKIVEFVAKEMHPISVVAC